MGRQRRDFGEINWSRVWWPHCLPARGAARLASLRLAMRHPLSVDGQGNGVEQCTVTGPTRGRCEARHRGRGSTFDATLTIREASRLAGLATVDAIRMQMRFLGRVICRTIRGIPTDSGVSICAFPFGGIDRAVPRRPKKSSTADRAAAPACVAWTWCHMRGVTGAITNWESCLLSVPLLCSLVL